MEIQHGLTELKETGKSSKEKVARGERTAEIYLPMKRSDIGEYLGMSLEAVSRAFRALTTRGIIKSRDRRHLKIADRSTFDKIAADMSIIP